MGPPVAILLLSSRSVPSTVFFQTAVKFEPQTKPDDQLYRFHKESRLKSQPLDQRLRNDLRTVGS